MHEVIELLDNKYTFDADKIVLVHLQEMFDSEATCS